MDGARSQPPCDDFAHVRLKLMKLRAQLQSALPLRQLSQTCVVVPEFGNPSNPVLSPWIPGGSCRRAWKPAIILQSGGLFVFTQQRTQSMTLQTKCTCPACCFHVLLAAQLILAHKRRKLKVWRKVCLELVICIRLSCEHVRVSCRL